MNKPKARGAWNVAPKVAMNETAMQDVIEYIVYAIFFKVIYIEDNK